MTFIKSTSFLPLKHKICINLTIYFHVPTKHDGHSDSYVGMTDLLFHRINPKSPGNPMLLFFWLVSVFCWCKTVINALLGLRRVHCILVCVYLDIISSEYSPEFQIQVLMSEHIEFFTFNGRMWKVICQLH